MTPRRARMLNSIHPPHGCPRTLSLASTDENGSLFMPMTDPLVPADPQTVLRLAGVDLVRGDRLLLDQVSVTVRAGEHWALLGPNGAGKSTVLRIMATYAHPTRGEVHVLGHRLGRVNVFSLRPWIGQVSPDHPVAPARTVRHVVFTGATGTLEIVPRAGPPCPRGSAAAR
jgi:iron complex transport system ATP-binding protein